MAQWTMAEAWPAAAVDARASFTHLSFAKEARLNGRPKRASCTHSALEPVLALPCDRQETYALRASAECAQERPLGSVRSLIIQLRFQVSRTRRVKRRESAQSVVR